MRQLNFQISILFSTILLTNKAMLVLPLMSRKHVALISQICTQTTQTLAEKVCYLFIHTCPTKFAQNIYLFCVAECLVILVYQLCSRGLGRAKLVNVDSETLCFHLGASKQQVNVSLCLKYIKTRVLQFRKIQRIIPRDLSYYSVQECYCFHHFTGFFQYFPSSSSRPSYCNLSQAEGWKYIGSYKCVCAMCLSRGG